METLTLKTFCSGCSQPHDFPYRAAIDVSSSPELKAKVLDGSLFTWNCPHCGKVNLANYPLLYHDPEEKLMIVLTEAPVNAEGLGEGYTGRLVRSVGELIEKVKIFDAGLDDIAVEMVKMVTAKELGKDVTLKFFKLDGADSEMTFTYPEKGNMEMLVSGFNVYEDCAGILKRNPRIKETAHGLVSIDRRWLSQFFE